MKRFVMPAVAVVLGALTVTASTSGAVTSTVPGTAVSVLPFDSAAGPLNTRQVHSGPTSQPIAASPVAGVADQDPEVTTTAQKSSGHTTTVTTTEKTATSPDNARTITVLGVTWDGSADRDVEIRTRHAKAQTWGPWENMPVSDDGGDPSADDSSADDSSADDSSADDSSANQRGSTEAIVVAPYEVAQVRANGPVTVSVSVTERTRIDDIIAGNAVDTSPTPQPSPAGQLAEVTGTSAGVAPAYSAQNVAQINGLQYVSRSQWGAKKEQCPIEHVKRNEGVVIHHTDGANGYDQQDVPGILRGIQAYHQDGRGWCDIGYNMLVDRFGKVYEGRAGGLDTATVGAHAVAVNRGTFGVSVMGTYNKPAPPAVVNALARIIRWQSQKWDWDINSNMKLTSAGGPGARKPKGEVFDIPRVVGHRDVGFTDCPGDGLYGQIPQIRALASGSEIDEYANDHELGKPSGAITSMKYRDGGMFRVYGDTLVSSHPEAGTHGMSGAILAYWEKAGWERSPLGLPTGEMGCGLADGGCYQKFEHGAIHWSKATGAHATVNAIHRAWAETNYERGPLGYPVSDEKLDAASGVFTQQFQHGTIRWTKKSGAEVKVTTVSGGAKQKVTGGAKNRTAAKDGEG